MTGELFGTKTTPEEILQKHQICRYKQPNTTGGKYACADDKSVCFQLGFPGFANLPLRRYQDSRFAESLSFLTA